MKGIHLIAFLSLALAVDGNQYGNVLNANHKESNDLNYRMDKALAYLDTIGVEPHKLSLYHENLKSEQDISSETPRRRIEDEEEGESPDNYWFYIINASLALVCVCVAALAAGLTMGLVSQEIIDLKIREVASESDLEREQVRSLVPLLMDHHRLLVTLLLINALANEALPLFLDKIVPGYVAVILSVTLVLFFGEIIPSAIFSGPNKIAIASKLAPLVRFFLVVLSPLAVPIAKILDLVLHGDEHDEGIMQKYDKKELSALVRLQFEERRNMRRRRKKHRTLMSERNVGKEDPLVHSYDKEEGLNASKEFVKHADEVTMIEGALQMETKTVKNVMTRWEDVYSISMDSIMDEETVVDVYRHGHSRIPIKNENGDICGILLSRQLIVVNSEEERPLQTIPFLKPHYIDKDMNMVDAINLLQTGTVGQLGIVCDNVNTARKALESHSLIPISAGIMGIVSLEDCIEELIQEEIYDEYDTKEKKAFERAQWVTKKWKAFVAKKRSQRNEDDDNEKTSLLSMSDIPPKYDA